MRGLVAERLLVKVAFVDKKWPVQPVSAIEGGEGPSVVGLTVVLVGITLLDWGWSRGTLGVPLDQGAVGGTGGRPKIATSPQRR